MSDDPNPAEQSATSGPDPAKPASDGADRAGPYRVELPSFEGPLDLLLHLIKQHELDILDIPIGFVTEKYVAYIKMMGDLNIDVASEYLVMAATLAYIKSQMLLPPSETTEEEEPEAEIDPRAELVRRLLEYQKYKHAAEGLSGRDVLGRDVFLRGMPLPEVEGPAPLAPLSLFKLLDAFEAVLKRAKSSVDHEFDIERFSVTDRISQLVDVLKRKPRLAFEELFSPDQTRADMIITFLALLEMTRLRMTRLTQRAPLEPIEIELSVQDDDETATGADGSGPEVG